MLCCVRLGSGCVCAFFGRSLNLQKFVSIEGDVMVSSLSLQLLLFLMSVAHNLVFLFIVQNSIFSFLV